MKGRYQIVSGNGRGKFSADADRSVGLFFSDHGQQLLPLVDLIEDSRVAVDELIQVAGRIVIETVLQMSVEKLAGPSHAGRRSGDLVRYGKQPGVVTLSNRKLQVERPRLRKKGVGRGGEVSVPAYEKMQDDSGLGPRMLSILMKGVSTRNYEGVIGEMADSVGVSKSSVSREFIEAGKAELASLLARRFDDKDILAVYIDGQEFSGHHVLAAVGVDGEGYKHVLGLYAGATENSTVVKGLLLDLVERGGEGGSEAAVCD